jgi:hypothetical protein
MHQAYNKRQYSGSQAEANREKLALARALERKEVVIGGVARRITGYSELTGDVEIRIGTKTLAYDPRILTVVEGR